MALPTSFYPLFATAPKSTTLYVPPPPSIPVPSPPPTPRTLYEYFASRTPLQGEEGNTWSRSIVELPRVCARQVVSPAPQTLLFPPLPPKKASPPPILELEECRKYLNDLLNPSAKEDFFESFLRLGSWDTDPTNDIFIGSNLSVIPHRQLAQHPKFADEPVSMWRVAKHAKATEMKDLSYMEIFARLGTTLDQHSMAHHAPKPGDNMHGEIQTSPLSDPETMITDLLTLKPSRYMGKIDPHTCRPLFCPSVDIGETEHPYPFAKDQTLFAMKLDAFIRAPHRRGDTISWTDQINQEHKFHENSPYPPMGISPVLCQLYFKFGLCYTKPHDEIGWSSAANYMKRSSRAVAYWVSFNARQAVQEGKLTKDRILELYTETKVGDLMAELVDADVPVEIAAQYPGDLILSSCGDGSMHFVLTMGAHAEHMAWNSGFTPQGIRRSLEFLSGYVPRSSNSSMAAWTTLPLLHLQLVHGMDLGLQPLADAVVRILQESRDHRSLMQSNIVFSFFDPSVDSEMCVCCGHPNLHVLVDRLCLLCCHLKGTTRALESFFGPIAAPPKKRVFPKKIVVVEGAKRLKKTHPKKEKQEQKSKPRKLSPSMDDIYEDEDAKTEEEEEEPEEHIVL